MRDIHQLLKEKEGSIEQFRREIEALRSVTPILSDARPDFRSPPFVRGREPDVLPTRSGSSHGRSAAG